jgi:imidazolonepropionase-like amidohydrolase
MNEMGMPVEEALQLATLKNADLLDQSDQLGQLKPGYLADIIATDESPNKNISTLTNVTFVMKDGVVYKN